MKTHTIDFKNELKNMGRQLDSFITYGNTTLKQELYSVTMHYQGSILKSIMKQLDIESSVDIPKDTILNFQIGIKIGNQYEYMNYGNFVVVKSEKQEDLDKYKITCYDKMIYAMQDNEDLGVTYPISIKNYLTALATKIGLQVQSTTFANQDRMIPAELFVGLEYTYRDILDQIAEATGSNIIINANDRLEVKYFTNTNDTIDEEFLKDINVTFKEKFGAINTIVLSRSAEADNIYYPSPVPENPVELKIKDNQFMNDNNRVDYLPELYQKLNGMEFYTNDFNSTGILYYEPCDVYTITVRGQNYNCVMLSDEITITTGIEEIINTEMPEQTQTDYTKADKTDRRINETYLIVDKQNQAIESVISNVSEQNNKISQITQTVDEINAKIEDIADITISGESIYADLSLDNINESEPIELKVHPFTTNISYMYPRNDLYPANDLYMPDRKIRFIRTYEEGGQTLTQNIDYILPDDLLYYDSNNYDEFYLNYDSQTCQVTKKCKYNADGTVGLLANPITTDYTYPEILLSDGDYEIKILGYNMGYISARLMAQNIYTTQFATKSEMNSAINQSASNINLSVDQKLTNYSTTTQMNSAIDIRANEINSVVSTKVGNDEVISKINQSSEAVQINANKISLVGKQINLTGDNTTITSTNFSVDKNGNMTASNGTFTNGEVILSDNGLSAYEGKLRIVGNTFINGQYSEGVVIRKKNSPTNTTSPQSIFMVMYNNEPEFVINGSTNSNYTFSVSKSGLASSFNNGVNFSVDGTNKTAQLLNITDFFVDGTIHQLSKEDKKKNFEKFENGLDIVKATDIYKYNLKLEEDGTKKHIGFIIGDKYNYSKELTSNNNDGVDTYSMISVAYKAIQEQQEEIEQLQEKIKKLEEGKNE